MTEERQIVIPGETLATGLEFLPGEGAYRDGKDIVSKRFGIKNASDNHIRVIPISGVYYPRRGNTIIGVVVDITFNGWILDFGGPQNAFLGVSEVPRYINKDELREFLDFGDTAVVKVWEVKPRGVDVSMKMRGFGKLEGGMIVNINPHKVPRVIGKEGSMVKIIKEATKCSITVGQNGFVWIYGKKIEDELKAKKIIEFVAENAVSNGLTEAVEAYIKELEKEESEDFEIIEEDTDK